MIDDLLIEDVTKCLIEKGYTISFAESFTGGLLASSIISIPDASKVIKESYVTYSDESKVKILGVDMNTIKEFGVVSKEVALEMAKGLKKITNSDVVISTTGYAGPTSYDGLEVGTACFAIIIKNTPYIYKEVFKDLSRNEVREQAIDYILGHLFCLLNSSY